MRAKWPTIEQDGPAPWKPVIGISGPITLPVRVSSSFTPRRRPPLRFGRLLLAALDNRCFAHPGGALRRPSRSCKGDELDEVFAPVVELAVGHQQHPTRLELARRSRVVADDDACRPATRASAIGRPRRAPGSRLFVGSSSSSRLWRPATSCASASFVFSPPDSVPASWKAFSPLSPNIPSRPRSSTSVVSGVVAHVVEQRASGVDALVLLRVVADGHTEPEVTSPQSASPPRPGSAASWSCRRR